MTSKVERQIGWLEKPVRLYGVPVLALVLVVFDEVLLVVVATPSAQSNPGRHLEWLENDFMSIFRWQPTCIRSRLRRRWRQSSQQNGVTRSFEVNTTFS